MESKIKRPVQKKALSAILDYVDFRQQQFMRILSRDINAVILGVVLRGFAYIQRFTQLVLFQTTESLPHLFVYCTSLKHLHGIIWFPLQHSHVDYAEEGRDRNLPCDRCRLSPNPNHSGFPMSLFSVLLIRRQSHDGPEHAAASGSAPLWQLSATRDSSPQQQCCWSGWEHGSRQVSRAGRDPLDSSHRRAASAKRDSVTTRQPPL